ncbi:fructosamine kinase family protein [Pseudolysinimonas kribbensis]|uniref:Fructosamine kinase n=1 Tax=Pseudolysinimonas kribbensis TaxID=433641 RepID=A0ABQ6K0M5_9MICO|nr:fructosamine kinase family protein [Pseudolysinimonas kribbensis]GMA94168.1 fructosamine kinase [Pseudolysinimonas kribbensis]
MSTFRKERPDAPAGSFEAEAAGLRWLAEAAAQGGADVVLVHGAGPAWIALDRLAPVRPTADAARAFGAALARTHAAGAPAFGWAPGTGPWYIGRQELACTPSDSWGAFYAEQRVLPYARRARDRGHLGADGLAVVELACARVASGALDDDEPPARLHGDLWNGNVVWTRTGVVLIDPAAHGGHRETDLAMLQLFGLPELDQVLAGYEAEAPLRPGWRRRVPLHQLHPLAVHAASHGASYGAPLVAAAQSTLDLG